MNCGISYLMKSAVGAALVLIYTERDRATYNSLLGRRMGLLYR